MCRFASVNFYNCVPRSEIPTIVNCIVLGKLESYYGTYQAVKSLTTVGTLESDSKKKLSGIHPQYIYPKYPGPPMIELSGAAGTLH